MFRRQLIATETALRDYIRSSVPVTGLGHIVSLDTETTGLDVQKADLVAMSMSVSDTSGIMLPVGFKYHSNLHIPRVIGIIKEEIEALDATVLFYNSPFDRNILEHKANYLPEKWEDVLNLVHHENPDRRPKDLKTIAVAEVGMEMSHIESLFSKEEIAADMLDMSGKRPEDCLVYATDDAIATRRIFLAEKYQSIYSEKAIKFALDVDRHVIEMVREAQYYGGFKLRGDYIENQIVYLEAFEEFLEDRIKRGIAARLSGDLLEKWKARQDAFKITSPQQLGTVLFDEIGFQSPGLTEGKKPQHKTGEGDLEELGKKYPLIEAILLYRKVKKARTTYFMKLKKLVDNHIPPRFNFNLFTVPTYRFAAPGGDPFRDGATGVNIQAVSNGRAQNLTGLDLSGIDESAGYTGLPYVLKTAAGNFMCARYTCIGCPASCFPSLDPPRSVIKDVLVLPSVRQAFKAPEGYVLVSCDYERQELVVGANLSGDVPWIKALSLGEDLHLLSASEGFNTSLEDLKALPAKALYEKRQAGKVSNFTVFYGGGPGTLASNTGIDLTDAKKFIARFKQKHPMLFGWMDAVMNSAQWNGYVTLGFGRRRWLKQFYEKGMEAFANRSAVNTIVQGTSAEITRIAIARIYKSFKKNNITREEASFAFQLHDEVSFFVRKDCLERILPLIIGGMKIHVPSWKVQLSVEEKIGEVWGQQKAGDSHPSEEKIEIEMEIAE